MTKNEIRSQLEVFFAFGAVWKERNAMNSNCPFLIKSSETELIYYYFSVGRDCELVMPEQTIIRVTVDDSPNNFKVNYTLPESENAKIIQVISLKKNQYSY